MRYSAPVRPIVLARFPATLELSLAALAVCIAIAVPAGVATTDPRVIAIVLMGFSSGLMDRDGTVGAWTRRTPAFNPQRWRGS